MSHPLDAQTKQEAFDALAKYGSISKAARVLQIPESTLRSRIKRATDDDRFPIVPGKSILYDAEGDIKAAWAKGGPDRGPSTEEITEAVEAVLKRFKRPPAVKMQSKGDADLLGIWPLADLHMGMRAWGAETGGPDWDIGIATAAYQEGLQEVTAMTPAVKHGVVLVAGDLAHADNYFYQTSNPGTHHVVDCDGRYPKMLEASVDIVAYAAQLAAQKSETLDIVVLPGNHDAAATVAVRLTLAAIFQNSKKINVSKSPSRYWWYEWGQCMFAATHGDKNNTARLPEYMAAQMSEMWGRTTHRYAFTGHKHRKLVEGRPGVRVEILPTPVAPDSFASDYGYLSPRIFETKVYHRTKGLRHTPTVIL